MEVAILVSLTCSKAVNLITLLLAVLDMTWAAAKAQYQRVERCSSAVNSNT
jgi:hypothetical protein